MMSSPYLSRNGANDDFSFNVRSSVMIFSWDLFLNDARDCNSNSSFLPFTETSKILSDNIITYKLKEMDCLIFIQEVNNLQIFVKRKTEFRRKGLDFTPAPFELSHLMGFRWAFLLQIFDSKILFDSLKLVGGFWIF